MPLIEENPSALIDEAGRSESGTTYISQADFLKELDEKSNSSDDEKSEAGRSFVREIQGILSGR